MADARRIANRPTGEPCSRSFRVRGPTAMAAFFGSAALGRFDATAVGGHPDASDPSLLHGRRAHRRSSRSRHNWHRRRVERKPKPAPRKTAIGSSTSGALRWLADDSRKDPPWAFATPTNDKGPKTVRTPPCYYRFAASSMFWRKRHARELDEDALPGPLDVPELRSALGDAGDDFTKQTRPRAI